MQDEEVAKEIQKRGLELEYLRELAAVVGFADAETWSIETFEAMERATPEQKRSAALRTLDLSP